MSITISNGFSVIRNKVFVSDDTLTQWINSSATLDNTIGNPIPGLKTIGNANLKRDLGEKFINKTITFDIRLPTAGDAAFIFANTNAGTGTYRTSLRMKYSTTATLQGLSFTDNGGWQYAGLAAGGETTAIFTTSDIWYNIKIKITPNRVVTWFVNDVLQSSTVTLAAGYATADSSHNYFGFNGQAIGSTAYWDNFKIIDGVS